jgi:hypothetical protein
MEPTEGNTKKVNKLKSAGKNEGKRNGEKIVIFVK